MNYLAIDTTNSTLTVVLRNGEQLLYTRKEMEKAEHSTSLMPTIDEIISKANMIEIARIKEPVLLIH